MNLRMMKDGKGMREGDRGKRGTRFGGGGDRRGGKGNWEEEGRERGWRAEVGIGREGDGREKGGRGRVIVIK